MAYNSGTPGRRTLSAKKQRNLRIVLGHIAQAAEKAAAKKEAAEKASAEKAVSFAKKAAAKKAVSFAKKEAAKKAAAKKAANEAQRANVWPQPANPIPSRDQDLLAKMRENRSIHCASDGCRHNVPYSFIRYDISYCRSCSKKCTVCNEICNPDDMNTGLYSHCCTDCTRCQNCGTQIAEDGMYFCECGMFR